MVREVDSRAIVHEERARYHELAPDGRRAYGAEERIRADALWSWLRGIKRGEHPLVAGACALSEIRRLLERAGWGAARREAYLDIACEELATVIADYREASPRFLSLRGEYQL